MLKSKSKSKSKNNAVLANAEINKLPDGEINKLANAEINMLALSLEYAGLSSFLLVMTNSTEPPGIDTQYSSVITNS